MGVGLGEREIQRSFIVALAPRNTDQLAGDADRSKSLVIEIIDDAVLARE